MKVKKLREYQTSIWRRLIRSRNNGKDSVLLCPTGSGKTSIARNLCSHVLNHKDNFGITKILITTPQKQILSGFVRTNYEEWYIGGKFSTQKINDVEIIEIPNTSIEGFLKGSSGNSIAISCVQSLINTNSNAFNLFENFSDCSNILWVIDEAHHMEAEQTSKIINDFRAKNGKLLYLTATPFNANGALPILRDPTVDIIHRSLGEHMKDGYAPELEMSYEMLDINAGTQINYGNFNSSENKIKYWAKSLASSYIKDNKPKTLIVIPSFSTSGEDDVNTQNAANILKNELEKLLEDIKILTVVGNDASGEISKKIELEANTFPGHDIIIACRRFDEGTDVPSISAVYLIGMTGCRRIIQLSGRALRDKKTIEGFSEKHPEYLNKSIFKFFIFNTENINDEDIEDNQYEFSLSAIKTINAVQNFQSYDLISGPVKVRRKLQERIEELVGKDPNNSDIGLYEELVEEIEKPILTLETSNENDDSMINLLAHNKMEHSNKDALENASESSLAYVQSNLLSNELKTDEDVEEFVDKVVSKKRNNKAKNVINEELVELVNKYSDEKVNYIESDLIKTFVTRLNCETLEEWGDVLWDNKEKQLENIKNIVKFYEENGRLPIRSRNCSDIESKLGAKLNRIKVSYHKKKLDESVIDFLKTNNKIFILYNREDRTLEKAKQFVEYIKLNIEIPENIKGWFSKYKSTFNGTNNGLTYDSVNSFLINQLGGDYLFSREQKNIKKAEDYVKYINKGIVINSDSEDLYVKDLAKWFTGIKLAYNGIRGKINIEICEYLNNNINEDIFNNVDFNKISMERAYEFVNYYISNNRKLPETNSKDKQVKQFSNWFHKILNTYRNLKNGNVLYNDVILFLKENLDKDCFYTKEEKCMEKAIKYVNYVVDRGIILSKNSKDNIEKQLALWFRNYKQVHHNRARGNTYESVTKYLKDNLGENIFD